jgi:hypothetical protein
MAKDTNYEQYKGQGMKYAPKPSAAAPKPAAPAPAPTASTGPSDEDKIRNAVRSTRAGLDDHWWQTTDGHQ